MIATQPIRDDSSECPVLVVDLDGTLIKSDMLEESANDYLATNPFRALILLAWLASGRSNLKAKLAQTTRVDVASLPYNEALVDWLKAQKSLGRTLVLATASHKLLAEHVAGHLGLFDEVFATENQVNLKAERKRDALVKRYGERGFDYVGDSRADLPVWRSAAKAYVVSNSPGLVAEVRTSGNLAETFGTGRKAWPAAMIKALRLHQWMKNLLVFIPMFAAHIFTNIFTMEKAFLAFFAFGLTASSVYLLNDLVDVTDDRHHVRKKNRPFASGNLSLLTGWLAWPSLLLVAFAIAYAFLPIKFVEVLAAYFAVTLTYSFRLKQVPVLDVLTLAVLYTMRIIAGAAAVSVPLSFWLLTFSMFVFLSLAFIKRFSELKAARSKGAGGQIRGRGYSPDDLEMISSLGGSAGYLAVLVLALYIQDANTAHLYQMPKLIWLACPILLFWISRVWLIAHRGQMHDDPIIFAIKDRVSLATGALFVAIFALATVL